MNLVVVTPSRPLLENLQHRHFGREGPVPTSRHARRRRLGAVSLRRVQEGLAGKVQLLLLEYNGGVCSLAESAGRFVPSSSPTLTRRRGIGTFGWRIDCRGREDGLDENTSLPKGRKRGRMYSRGGGRRDLIKSRMVKVGLMYKLVRFGRGGGGEGGGEEERGVGGGGGDGRGWGGGAGGGGGGGGDVPNPGEGGFSFFAGLMCLFRDGCGSRVWTWALSAFLAGFFVSLLDYGDYAYAKSVTKPRTALLEGADVIERDGGKGEGEEEKGGFSGGALWEVNGSQWRRFVVDVERDEFVFDVVKPSEEEAQVYEQGLGKKEESGDVDERIGASQWPGNGRSLEGNWRDAGVWASETVKQVFLPSGYPGSVTEGYLEFTSWRMGQIIASQVTGVLTTQALLYAVGLGKGAIPTAAAVNWVLRDGIGYLSKILLSKYGRHFDVHPKGWRLVSDTLENGAYGLELLTPVFPHLFVYLAATAGAGRSAAGMIQAATKSSFNANFAAQRNFAEIIAKGEAQGMASKSVGIGLGILISGYLGSQGPLLVGTFAAVSALHIFFNLRSYQAVHLRTLNPYRASLVLAEYLKSGNIPTIKDVNAEEPIFFGTAWFNPKPRRNQGKLDTVSPESKMVAAAFEKKLELGVSLGTLVHTRGEADALIDLYSKDNYLLAIQGESIKVVLKEGASPRDMLRAMVQAVYFLNLPNSRHKTSGDILNDCTKGGILQVTHDLMEQNFENITQVLSKAGWVSNGVLARASPNRLILRNRTRESFVGDKP